MSITLSQYKDRDRVLLVEKGRLHNAVSFTRASTATYFNGAGVLVTAATNAPRFEYDGLGNYLGLLIEEQRTNIILQSQSIGNSAWTKAGGGTGIAPVVTDNYAVSPDGTTNASRVVLNIASGTTSTDLSQVQPTSSITVTIGSTYTLSWWAKTNNGATVSINVIGMTGIIKIESITPTWKRYTRTEVAVSSSILSFRVRLRGNEATAKSADISLWGLQLELGSVTTSYIPTTSATVTRAGDVCKVTTLSNIRFNAAEGSFVCKAVQGTWAASPQTYFSLYGVAGTHIQVRRETKTTVNLALIFDASVAQSSLSPTVGDDGLSVKMAMGYKLNDIVGSANGLAVSTDTSATIPTVTTLEIGSFSGGNPMNGYIEYLAYYPKKRANVEFPGLST